MEASSKMTKSCMKTPTKRRSGYRQFLDEQTKVFGAKYPFLSSHQIKQRVNQAWSRLSQQQKDEYGSTCNIKSKVLKDVETSQNGSLVSPHDTQLNSSVPDKWLFTAPVSSDVIDTPQSPPDMQFHLPTAAKTYAAGWKKPSAFYKPPVIIEDEINNQPGILLSSKEVRNQIEKSRVSFGEMDEEISYAKDSSQDSGHQTDENTEKTATAPNEWIKNFVPKWKKLPEQKDKFDLALGISCSKTSNDFEMSDSDDDKAFQLTKLYAETGADRKQSRKWFKSRKEDRRSKSQYKKEINNDKKKSVVSKKQRAAAVSTRQAGCCDSDEDRDFQLQGFLVPEEDPDIKNDNDQSEEKVNIKKNDKQQTDRIQVVHNIVKNSEPDLNIAIKSTTPKPVQNEAIGGNDYVTPVFNVSIAEEKVKQVVRAPRKRKSTSSDQGAVGVEQKRAGNRTSATHGSPIPRTTRARKSLHAWVSPAENKGKNIRPRKTQSDKCALSELRGDITFSTESKFKKKRCGNECVNLNDLDPFGFDLSEEELLNDSQDLNENPLCYDTGEGLKVDDAGGTTDIIEDESSLRDPKGSKKEQSVGKDRIPEMKKKKSDTQMHNIVETPGIEVTKKYTPNVRITPHTSANRQSKRLKNLTKKTPGKPSPQEREIGEKDGKENILGVLCSETQRSRKPKKVQVVSGNRCSYESKRFSEIKKGQQQNYSDCETSLTDQEDPFLPLVKNSRVSLMYPFQVFDDINSGYESEEDREVQMGISAVDRVINNLRRVTARQTLITSPVVSGSDGLSSPDALSGISQLSDMKSPINQKTISVNSTSDQRNACINTRFSATSATGPKLLDLMNLEQHVKHTNRGTDTRELNDLKETHANTKQGEQEGHKELKESGGGDCWMQSGKIEDMFDALTPPTKKHTKSKRRLVASHGAQTSGNIMDLFSTDQQSIFG